MAFDAFKKLVRGLTRTREGIASRCAQDRLRGARRGRGDARPSSRRACSASDLGPGADRRGLATRCRRRRARERSTARGCARRCAAALRKALDGARGRETLPSRRRASSSSSASTDGGKTTTIGKLAARERAAGRKVIVVARPTRSARRRSIQLERWAERAGCRGRAASRRGRIPRRSVFDALEAAAARGDRHGARRHGRPAPHQGAADGRAREDGAHRRARGRRAPARGAARDRRDDGAERPRAGAGVHEGGRDHGRRARPSSTGPPKGASRSLIRRAAGRPDPLRRRRRGDRRSPRLRCRRLHRGLLGGATPRMSDRICMAQASALARAGRGHDRGRIRSSAASSCATARIVGPRFPPRRGRARTPSAWRSREAGDAARGATLYVNLEPCAHHGRTAAVLPRRSCRAGIRRVVAAIGDPNPLVDGRGFGALRAAGIDVDRGARSNRRPAR